MEPGKNSSEHVMMQRLMIAGVVLAVVSSFGSVPLNPQNVGVYLQEVAEQAKEWATVLVPTVGLVWGWYAKLRTDLKKNNEETE